MNNNISNQIDKELEKHFNLVSFKVKCIVVSKDVFLKLKDQINYIQGAIINFESMKYRGYDFHMNPFLKNNTIKIY